MPIWRLKNFYQSCKGRNARRIVETVNEVVRCKSEVDKCFIGNATGGGNNRTAVA